MCVEPHVGILPLVQRRDGLAPEQARLHHIGLLHAGDVVPALARQLERHARDALDLARGIALGVEPALLAVGQRLDAARLAEIDAAGALAHDHQVKAAHHVGLQRRGIDQRIEHDRGPQIGEQVEFLAQPQDRQLRAKLESKLLPFRSTDRAEQDGIGILRLLHRLVGDRRAARIDRGAAHQIVRDVERDHAAAVHPVDDATHLAHHLGADAVARQDQQLLVGGHRMSPVRPGGRQPGLRSRARAS